MAALRMSVATEIPENTTIMRDDRNGLIMPWLTRPCLAWLDRQRFASVFEWGVGYGSDWWRARAKYVGIEHDPQWCNKFGGILFDTESGYINAMQPCSALMPDIVVIDGEWRHDCGEALAARIRHSGPPKHIIIDNANWPDYSGIASLFRNMNVQAFWDDQHDDWLTVVLSSVSPISEFLS